MTREDVCVSGCSLGSLAAEIMKSDLDVHDEVAAGFGRWRGLNAGPASRAGETSRQWGVTPTSV